jgi:hypothetical protein
MLMDSRSEFANKTPIGATLGKVLLGDHMDLGSVRDIASAANTWLVVQVATTFTSAGAATLQVALASDSVNPPRVDGNETTHILSPVFALAQLTAGTQLLSIQLPLETDTTTYKRFLEIVATISVAAFTAGALNAFLTTEPRQGRQYADGRR